MNRKRLGPLPTILGYLSDENIDNPQRYFFMDGDDHKGAIYTENRHEDSSGRIIDEPNNLVSPKECQTNTENQIETGCSDGVVSIYKTPHSQRTERKPVRIDVDLVGTPKKVRSTPIPLLTWADSDDVWQNMIYKEEATFKTRNYKLFDERSTYLPRMRAILLDWLMEVCEVYHLRRNTYYLAIDYIDRYLTMKPSVPKTQLQLLGVACLFIAAKLDEIYPPKLSEFSYVCDGACTEEEILSCEILLLNTLGWEVNPMTPNGWLNLYMQIHYNAEYIKKHKLTIHDDSNFQYPQYSSYQFVRASQLMDLFSMDPGFVRFSYSMIAASAMYYLYGKNIALTVSGITWLHLKPCVVYMSIFNHTIKTINDPRLHSIIPDEQDERLESSFRSVRKRVPNIMTDENHAVQTHLIDLDYFEKSIMHRLESYGLEVIKVYVKKVKVDDENNPSSSDSEEFSEEVIETVAEPPKEGGSAVMYEIKPNPQIKIEGIRTEINYLKAIHPMNPDYELGKVNIYQLREKSTVTFDDILNSIHNDSPYLKFISSNDGRGE